MSTYRKSGIHWFFLRLLKKLIAWSLSFPDVLQSVSFERRRFRASYFEMINLWLIGVWISNFLLWASYGGNDSCVPPSVMVSRNRRNCQFQPRSEYRIQKNKLNKAKHWWKIGFGWFEEKKIISFTKLMILVWNCSSFPFLHDWVWFALFLWRNNLLCSGQTAIESENQMKYLRKWLNSTIKGRDGNERVVSCSTGTV